MGQTVFPTCPVCKQRAREEVLIPFSSSSVVGQVSDTYAHWIYSKCGFYIGLGNTLGVGIPEDIRVGSIPEIPEFIKEVMKSPSERMFFKPNKKGASAVRAKEPKEMMVSEA